jgi:hypothetical protein
MTEDSQLILYIEIIAICSEIHPKHENIVCGQDVEFLDLKPDVIYSNHCVLKGKIKFLFNKLDYMLVILHVALPSAALCCEWPVVNRTA